MDRLRSYDVVSSTVPLNQDIDAKPSDDDRALNFGLNISESPAEMPQNAGAGCTVRGSICHNHA
jgi:hypothetical protein